MRILKVLTILIFSLSIAGMCFANEYTDLIKAGTEAVKKGEYDKAAENVFKAIEMDPDEPLGTFALGVIYLHTGRLNDAEKQFVKTASIPRPFGWRSQYALAVIDLVRQRPEDAVKHLKWLRDLPDAKEEYTAITDYLAYINEQPGLTGGKMQLAVQTAAMNAVKSDKTDEAISLFKLLLSVPESERKAPTATFNKYFPVLLPMGRLTWLPPQKEEKVPIVSDKIILRADTAQSSAIKIILFYVDGVFAGVSNLSPYEYELDTKRYKNGLHEIKMEGRDEKEEIVSTKVFSIRVKNPASEEEEKQIRNAKRGLMDELWNCVIISESRKLAHYHLGSLYLKKDDKKAALEQFRKAAAYQSDLLDVQEQIKNLESQITE